MMKMMRSSCVLLFMVSCVLCARVAPKPDIIFVLTDDQDLTLNSLIALPRLKSLIADQGATLKNAYVTTPVCCPSRASILSGQYQHNHQVFNNSATGGCFGPAWYHGSEKKTMAVSLQAAGYNTGFAGKYMNYYFNTTHVPPGWDSWLGLLGNSVYYDYNVSDNGVLVSHGHNYSTDYFTDVVANRTYKFLAESFKKEPEKPVFAMIATPASHDPDTPAPQHANLFSNLSAPRTASFDFHVEGNRGKHWLVNWEKHPMSPSNVKLLDEKYRNRLRTLVSVDDIIGNVVTLLEKHDRLNNTYIFFFSDNGYHLGQFSVVFDKRLPYETDIHVPMFVRGPGIKPKSLSSDIVLNIDIAPTMLDLAGAEIYPSMDGRSFKKLLINPSPQNEIKEVEEPPIRSDFLLEYVGEYSHECHGLWPGCCVNDSIIALNWCIDSINNTYKCVRTIKNSLTDIGDFLYCEYDDAVNFKEYYDLSKDPEELINMYSETDPTIIKTMSARIKELSTCQGQQCW